MWMVDNRSPYAVERTWVRDKTGAHHWIVAVRATFAIREDGALSLADEQVAPKEIPEYAGEPGAASLRYEADLGPLKPSTDLTVLGSAYAPRGRPVTRVQAELRGVGIHKCIEVFGERSYVSELSGVRPSNPAPFVRQPICYEAAYGGTDAADPDPARHLRDSRNPIGRGVARSPRALLGGRTHAVQYPGRDPARSGPAGFGPLCSDWSPRRERAGTFDERWQRDKRPLLPDDYDDRFSLCAPADQQIDGYLRGGEAIELVNLTPQGLLRVTLPTIALSFATRLNGRTEGHSGHLVSVIIEPDDARLSLVYQSALVVHAREADYLDVTEVNER